SVRTQTRRQGAQTGLRTAPVSPVHLVAVDAAPLLYREDLKAIDQRPSLVLRQVAQLASVFGAPTNRLPESSRHRRGHVEAASEPPHRDPENAVRDRQGVRTHTGPFIPEDERELRIKSHREQAERAGLPRRRPQGKASRLEPFSAGLEVRIAVNL